MTINQLMNDNGRGLTHLRHEVIVKRFERGALLILVFEKCIAYIMVHQLFSIQTLKNINHECIMDVIISSVRSTLRFAT